jgi:LPXTG-motif cell wall-anchored protein
VKKLLAAVGVVLAAVVGLGASATAQPYPPVAPTVTAPSTVLPGATFVVVFTGCQPGETVHKELNGVIVATSCTGAGGTGRLMQAGVGSATATLTAPTVPGTYIITATGLTSGFTDTTTITVVGQTATTAATGGGGGGLPTTGSDNSSTLWIAGTAVIVGAGLLTVGLKRRRPAAS